MCKEDRCEQRICTQLMGPFSDRLAEAHKDRGKEPMHPLVPSYISISALSKDAAYESV